MLDIRNIISAATEREASDIHLTVGIPPSIRVDGQLIQIPDQERLMPEDTKKLSDELMDDYAREKFELKGEVDFSYSIVGFGRFRVNVYKQRGTVSMALRTVPLSVPSVDDLGLPPILKELAMKKRGLVLVTGPTGSGKSTTLAAMIDHMNKHRNGHIITLEDPIEYLHRHGKSIINQREVGHDTFSYADALRAALRQDPDVILIGEMRDLETISTAVTAAETGHLVLSTLHTIGAVQTIDRIIDVFPPDQQQQIKVQLASVLEGVISQQLIKKADNKGRIAALEIMLANAAIRNHVREGKTHQILSALQTGRKHGMVTMDAYLTELYRQGLISYNDAILHAVDRDMLSRLL